MQTLTFLGAAQTVTGSKHLLDAGDTRVLVDCGLFQGLKELRLRNWDPLPFDPSKLDAVVLTHAHLDHCGYLPRLVAQGFRGRIFCTTGTSALTRIVLADAGRLQEEDAEHANREHFSRHHPALPLFTEADAARAVSQLQPIAYGQRTPVARDVEVEFLNAGHLLGSAFARVTLPARQLLFGGDLGRYDRPVLPDPTPVAEADVLLVESTYGNRTHPPDDGGAALERIVKETAERGGKLIIPAFAIGRVEELLFWLKRLEEEQRVPVLPVYVDSPMATDALAQYEARLGELDPEIRSGAQTDRAARGQREVCRFCTKRFRTVPTGQASRELVRSPMPSIIISASGMATGGRVLHHLKAVLPDPRHTVLFAGYQAPGTRGRQLLDGMPEVKIHGQPIPVRARVARIDSMSAHADASEILRWLRGFSRPPSLTCIVHGELTAMDALQSAITRDLGWKTVIPRHAETLSVG